MKTRPTQRPPTSSAPPSQRPRSQAEAQAPPLSYRQRRLLDEVADLQRQLREAQERGASAINYFCKWIAVLRVWGGVGYTQAKEARAEIADLRHRLEQAQEWGLDWRAKHTQVVAERDRLREALEAVEWQPRNMGLEDSIVGVVAKVVEYCPWCLVSRSAGHSKDCLVRAALEGRDE